MSSNNSEEFTEVKFEDHPVEGSLDNSSMDQDDGTLNEPVSVTIKRDLTAVYNKFKYVVYPNRVVRATKGSRKRGKKSANIKAPLLSDWDLWGPLLLCTLMALLLQTTSDDHNPNFSQVFVMVWCGAAIVTVNSQLLGGKISFFQSVCVLGYCILPLTVSLVFCKFVLYVSLDGMFFIRAASVLAALGWSNYAANTFLGESQPFGRKGLAHYPICMFYSVIAWIVITHYPH